MTAKPSNSAASAFLAGLALLLQTSGCAADSGTRAVGAHADHAAGSTQDRPAAAEPARAPAVPAAATAPETPPEAQIETSVRPQQTDTAGEPPRPAVVAPHTPAPARTAPGLAAPAKTASPAATIDPARKPQPAATARSEGQALPPLALATLEQRLKDTSAIGVFTKLALKNQVDDILVQIRAHHEGRGSSTLNQVRQRYDQLLLKVHDLLKNGDPPLATAIMNSREAIWAVLTDPVKFAKL